jgi:predicted nucleic acid-binding protein
LVQSSYPAAAQRIATVGGSRALACRSRECLLVGARRKRIKAEQVPRFWDELATLPVDTQPALTLTDAKRVVALSEKHLLTVYDAIYLDLAQRRTIALGTLDRELIRAAKAESVALL